MQTATANAPRGPPRRRDCVGREAGVARVDVAVRRVVVTPLPSVGACGRPSQNRRGEEARAEIHGRREERRGARRVRRVKIKPLDRRPAPRQWGVVAAALELELRDRVATPCARPSSQGAPPAVNAVGPPREEAPLHPKEKRHRSRPSAHGARGWPRCRARHRPRRAAHRGRCTEARASTSSRRLSVRVAMRMWHSAPERPPPSSRKPSSAFSAYSSVASSWTQRSLRRFSSRAKPRAAVGVVRKTAAVVHSPPSGRLPCNVRTATTRRLTVTNRSSTRSMLDRRVGTARSGPHGRRRRCSAGGIDASLRESM